MSYFPRYKEKYVVAAKFFLFYIKLVIKRIMKNK